MDVFTTLIMGKPAIMWVGFFALVAVVLAADLGLFHRQSREISVRESLWTSAAYIVVSLLFGAWVWATLGSGAGSDFLTGYVVEKTLSIDNVFVMSMIFATLNIPARYQHRVLFWGIFGAIALRGLMIASGSAIVEQFHWVLYGFAGFLILTGFKMLTADETPVDLESHRAVRLVRRVIPVSPTLEGDKFWIMAPDGATGRLKRMATPLFLALVLVELADLVFALDSMPAIFAITTDPFIVTTSNIFAILGLRALYFGLAAVVDRFKYVKQALALVLMFIGAKVIVPPMLGIDALPPWVSLGVTLALVGGGIAVSLAKTRETPVSAAADRD